MSDLDFSGLMNLSDTPDTDNADSTDNKPSASADNSNGNHKLTKMQAEYRNIQATYKRLEQLKHDTSALKVQLMKDLEAGEKSDKQLLADALELISIATNDTAFKNVANRHLK